MDKYTKDKDTGPDNYITAGEKLVKIDLYRTFIIAVDILNGLNIIIFVNIIYYLIFLTNIASAKYFWFKKIYLDKKHS